DRRLRLRPRAQHRDDVLYVEPGEQGVDQLPSRPGVEGAHLFQRVHQPETDRHVQSLEPIGSPHRLARRHVGGVRQRLEHTVDVLAKKPLVGRVVQQFTPASTQPRVAVVEISPADTHHGVPANSAPRRESNHCANRPRRSGSALLRRSSSVLRTVRPSSPASSNPPQVSRTATTRRSPAMDPASSRSRRSTRSSRASGSAARLSLSSAANTPWYAGDPRRAPSSWRTRPSSETYASSRAVRTVSAARRRATARTRSAAARDSASAALINCASVAAAFRL